MIMQAVFALWIASALLIILERRVLRIFIFFCIFSLVTSLCYLFLGAPDVAMAEVAIGSFITVFFIICFEKYYGLIDSSKNAKDDKKEPVNVKGIVAPLLFTGFLFALFVYFSPDAEVDPYLRDLYVSRFAHEIGGSNAVTAIYLGYRVYDTLLEALMLLISVVAVSHLSWHGETKVTDGKRSILREDKAVFIVRIICPVILLVGLYLVTHGHVSAGGGFQGGVLIASFFICRYMVHDIYDIKIDKFANLEKLIFASLTLIAVLVVSLGVIAHWPTGHLVLFQNTYLIMMNALIGLKVTCSFTILCYRYIAIEGR